MTALAQVLQARYVRAFKGGANRLDESALVKDAAIGCIFKTNEQLRAFHGTIFAQFIQQLPILLLVDWAHGTNIPVTDMEWRDAKTLCIEPFSGPHNAADIQLRIEELDRCIRSHKTKTPDTEEERLLHQQYLTDCHEEKRQLENYLKERKVW